MRKVLILLMPALLSWATVTAQNLKPYTIGAETPNAMSDVKKQVRDQLKANNFSVVGEYQPAGDANRWVFVVTSAELKNAVKATSGARGFLLALRVAVTRENGKTIVSYTTPEYWGNAYYQKDYPKVASNFTTIASNLKTAFSSIGTNSGATFGSEKGISPSSLRKYQYMIGMQAYEDNVVLAEFGSYQEAVDKIDANFAKGVPNLKKVYSVEMKDKSIKLYGVGLSGPKGEGNFLPKIDLGSPKHSAFLPYEMMVVDKKVYMLHGRFRIALSFPDLTMGTFTKIMSTPGDIEDLLRTATQ